MQVIPDLDHFPLSNKICGLTLGNFDGVHRGHQAIFHHVRQRIGKEGQLIVHTFTNHPLHVLSQNISLPFITTLEHKLKLLKECGVDIVILTTFTKIFANIPFDQFLNTLKAKTGFSHLVLGEGAGFGKNKEGDEKRVRALTEKLDFQVDYIPKLNSDDTVISSGYIRTWIAEGQFSSCAHSLGRPYSIYAPLHPEKGHFYIQLSQVCLPPDGIYPVRIEMQGKRTLGRAHIDRRAERLRVDFAHEPGPAQIVQAEIVFN